MESILVVLLLATVAFGGVLEPKAEDVQEAMRLWQSHCSNGKSEGQEGSAYIYCKIGKASVEEEREYEINVTPSSTAPKQIIFVQAPPYVYKHSLSLRGGSSPPTQTKIYVLPSKTEHSYDYQDERDISAAVNKPQLYFLKSNLGDVIRREPTQTPAPGGYVYNKPAAERISYSTSSNRKSRLI